MDQLKWKGGINLSVEPKKIEPFPYQGTSRLDDVPYIKSKGISSYLFPFFPTNISVVVSGIGIVITLIPRLIFLVLFPSALLVSLSIGYLNCQNIRERVDIRVLQVVRCNYG